MRIRLVLLALCGLAAAAPAAAQSEASVNRWRPIAIQDGDTTAIDTLTVRQLAPGVYRAWLREAVGYGLRRLTEETAYKYSVILQEFDCANDRSRYLELVYYLPSGQTVESITLPDTAGWSRNIPDSRGEFVARQVCVYLSR